MKKWMTVGSVLVASSALLLAGCSKKDEAASPDYKLEKVKFPLKDEVTLKFMTSSSP